MDQPNQKPYLRSSEEERMFVSSAVTVATDPGSRESEARERPAASGGVAMPQPPLLHSHDGQAQGDISGESVLREVLALLVDRLPQVPLNDPAGPALRRLAPALARSLGLPRARALPTPQQRLTRA